MWFASRNEHWLTLPSVGNQVNTRFKARSRDAGPKVRIRLPPAESPRGILRSHDGADRDPTRTKIAFSVSSFVPVNAVPSLQVAVTVLVSCA
jgi:hypothetical protein